MKKSSSGLKIEFAKWRAIRASVGGDANLGCMLLLLLLLLLRYYPEEKNVQC